MSESKKVITRFAPSPTGFLHIGGVRTALFAWAYARKNNGTFILRIEDTDKAREVPGSIEHIIKSLKWVGVTWDEGVDIGGPNAPYLQSERLVSYKKYAQILVDKGLAYADPYTPEEVEAFRQKAQEEKRPFLFRDHRPENPPIWDGTQPLRFKITDIKTYHWDDLVYGSLSAGPEALDDFILIKSDGYPTYNLSHIIDDLEMGVTHIMRADEFIASTPKFLALYEALEITPPAFATLPPIMAPDGKKKLGKRDGAKDILDYKAEGYLPQAMLNFLVFIGWNPGGDREVMSAEEFIDAFDISRIHHSGGGFNVVKLDWFNKEHLKAISDEEFTSSALQFVPEDFKNKSFDESIFKKLIPMLRERISKFSDVKNMCEAGELDYFFSKPNLDVGKLNFKETPNSVTKDNLERMYNVIEQIEDGNFTVVNLKDTLMSNIEKDSRGPTLHPLRFSLSGIDQSPDPFTICSVIGKDEALSRIKIAISLLSK